MPNTFIQCGFVIVLGRGSWSLGGCGFFQHLLFAGSVLDPGQYKYKSN